MRRLGLLAGLLAALPISIGGAANAAPMREPTKIMSIGLCADQYVLALLPRERIASVTSLARTGTARLAALAATVPMNHQRAEEVLAEKPDLIVADSFSDPSTRAMLARLHYRVIDVNPASDLPAIRAEMLRLGDALDARDRAHALVARMDRDLRAMKPLSPIPTVAAWDGSGRLPAEGSLYDSAINAAGARNLGRSWKGGRFGTEALLIARPDYLLHDRHVLDLPGRDAELVGHPLVRRLYARRQIVISQESLVCGTPATIDAVVDLNRELAKR